MTRTYKPLTHFCDLRLEDGKICNRGFRNRSGLTQHVNAKHHPFAPINPAPSPSTAVIDDVTYPASEGEDILSQPDRDNPAVDPHMNVPTSSRQVDKHPILDGMKLVWILWPYF